MLTPGQAKGTLIGDDLRDKWLGFLNRAFELGYLTREEFDLRSDVVLNARYAEDINPVLRDFPRKEVEAWSGSWRSVIEPFTPPRLSQQDVPELRTPFYRSPAYIIMALSAFLVLLTAIITLLAVP